jgi:sigma-E factor negative regulatory protein RseC
METLRDGGMVEGHARVVAVEAGRAWLEPEAPPACGGCSAKPGCGTASLGTAKRGKRFSVRDDFRARVGERVVVGITQSALTRATAVAYAIPLVALLAAALAAHALGAGDAGTAAAAALGLAGGIAVARRAAGRMTRLGALSPVVLRRARDENCPSSPVP